MNQRDTAHSVVGEHDTGEVASGETRDRTRQRPRYAQVVEQLAGSQKSPVAVPAYTRYVNRPLGRRLAALAYLAGLGPNQVTGLSLLSSCVGMVLLWCAPITVATGMAVGLALLLGYALDSADGQVARLTGTGGPAGEWLDHVTDQFRNGCLHVSVVVFLVRALPELPAPALLVPLGYGVVVSTRFLSQILAEQLRRQLPANTSADTGPQNGVSTDAASDRRAWWQLPADPGVLCLSFLLTGWPAVFFAAYVGLLVANTALAAASVVRRHRELVAWSTMGA